MKLATKLLALYEVLGGETQDTAEVRMSFENIKKAIPHIKGRIPHAPATGASKDIETATKAVATLERFTDTLIKDIKKYGLSDKVMKGIKNFLSILDSDINPDIMKVIDMKQKNVKLAIDMISTSVRTIDTLYRLRK
jgi:hypothetical protein